MSKETALFIAGSKGMALDTAKRLAKRGVNLILVAREQDGLDNAKAEIGQNVNVETVMLDLYDYKAVDEFAKKNRQRQPSY